jgi:hypothetical protein
MNIQLLRKTFTDKSTIGTLMFDSYTCDTLEPPEQLGILIPQGKYECNLSYSEKHGRVLLRVLGFDNNTREIHVGNSAKDTLGCILVGEYDQSTPDWISNSQKTFREFWDALCNCLKYDYVDITLEVL